MHLLTYDRGLDRMIIAVIDGLSVHTTSNVVHCS